ncbi:MAG: ABC transporter permease [Planctomycetia bacterium]|nr:ABC transporter permease [Planctomycetia bacterium]
MFKYILLIGKNLRRNLLRTTLTALGTMVLVLVVTLVWSVLYLLDGVMAEKGANLKAIVTERWQVPSQMPFAYARTLGEGAARNAGDVRPQDSMTWQFFGGSLEPNKRTREDLVFAFGMEPKKLATMMDDLDNLPAGQSQQLQANIRLMEEKRQAILIGRQRLAEVNKRVGERIKLYGVNFREIDLEFDIIGSLPPGRYDQFAVMNRDYLNEALDNYPRTHAGKKHPMADKSLNLVWVRVPDREQFSRVADQIARSPLYSDPAVKCETASSGIAAFLDAYRDLIWGLRWLLSPAILVTLSLVISNAISISVRERRLEMAVLKVLGFRPGQLLILVLGEALLIGISAGLLSAGATYFVVNKWLGGVALPIGFFPVFFIPVNALWWGVGIGTVTSLSGSIMPALSAGTVKVSDVFSKVA